MTASRLTVERALARDRRPLVLHVVHRFDTGGLENGLVNLIDQMPEQAYRHAVLALTEATSFHLRIRRTDVGVLSLHKQPGHGAAVYPAYLRLMRELRPQIVHTRNLGPLEMQFASALAGIPVRVHGEHGRETNDIDGTNRRLQWVRRLYSPFVHRYVALSRDLEHYLVHRVGIAARRVRQIYNGVDADRFRPAAGGPRAIQGSPFGPDAWVIGTVGRMQAVKNQTLLARAFVRALELAPAMRSDARLALVGEGPLRQQCSALLVEAGCADLAWMPGERGDVADVMRGLGCFVLPSLAEGISNTILEAMASGVPVIATRVGGNAELVDDERTGLVVPTDDVEALARAIVRMHSERERSRVMGAAGRLAVLDRFSLKAMADAYRGLYDECRVRACGSPQVEHVA